MVVVSGPGVSNLYSIIDFLPEFYNQAIYQLFSRASAYSIEFTLQISKKREHVSRFLDFNRGKMSVQELSDNFGTVYNPFLLSAKL